MITSGWTDDLFPASEALRYYNRTRLNYPGAPLSLNLVDYGHPRGQNKAATVQAINSAENAWFDHYVMGNGSAPPSQVQALTQTCPTSAAPGGPYIAPTYEALAPGELRFKNKPAQRMATDGTEHPEYGGTPGTGGSFPSACLKTDGTDTPETANYRFETEASQDITLLGSPTVIAKFDAPGDDTQVAARLFDIDGQGRQTLVARGLWRPEVSNKPVEQVFQLFPNGYHFNAGHSIKLELAPHDDPYGVKYESQRRVEISNLELRLPVREAPGALNGEVVEPAPKVIPWRPGVRLAPDYDEGAPARTSPRAPLARRASAASPSTGSGPTSARPSSAASTTPSSRPASARSRSTGPPRASTCSGSAPSTRS